MARHWVLFYCRSEAGHGRLAVTASTRYGGAVERNRFRRRMREFFRQHKEQLAPFDLHFVAKNNSHRRDELRYKRELRDDFAKLLTLLDPAV